MFQNRVLAKDLSQNTSTFEISFSTTSSASRGLHLKGGLHPKADAPARISLACMTCRSRKVRCNGESPCSSCVASNRECAFDHAKSRRKRRSVALSSVAKAPRANPYSSTLSRPAAVSSFRAHSLTAQDSNAKIYQSSNRVPSIPPVPPHSEGDAPSHPPSSRPEDAGANKSNGLTQSGNGSESLPTRIPYFRFLGPTAIAPGAPFREISMKLVREGVTKSESPLQDRREDSGRALKSDPSGRNGPLRPLSTPENHEGAPALTADEFRANVDVFYDHMGSFLACIKKDDLLHSLSQGKASEALKLAISALAECIQPSSTTVDHAEIRSNRSKWLCVPHLSLPSLDTTYTLLLIAYCEFGRDKDSGLWMWSGLAFRMATDLGLHKTTGIRRSSQATWDDSEAGLRQRIFWSCYHLDRLISSGTGRVATLLDSEIEIDLPPMYSLPAGSGISTAEEMPAPFHHLTRILILLGKISDTFNQSKVNATHFAEDPAKALQRFRADLYQFYADLPPALHFTLDNARRYISVKHGQAFTLLHLWFHTLVILTHNPTSVGPGWSSIGTGTVDPIMLEWSRGSVHTISDMIAFGNAFDPDIFLSVPFASQPIMIAGLASIPRQSKSPNESANIGRDFEINYGALVAMHARWRGVSWLISTLRSRASYELDVDLSTSCGAEVSTCDRSLMNKLLETREGALFDLRSADRRARIGSCLGLSASGMFHEPASGRLSFVHQPDELRVDHANTHSTSSSSSLKAQEEHQDYNWAASCQPNIPVASGQQDDTTLHSQLPPAKPHAASDDYENESVRLGNRQQTLKSADFGAVTKQAEAATPPQAAFANPSLWVTRTVPQIMWPDMATLGCDPGRLTSEATEGCRGDSIEINSSAREQMSGSNSIQTLKLNEIPEDSRNMPPALLGKEIWDELFRGEVGVWSSFQNG